MLVTAAKNGLYFVYFFYFYSLGVNFFYKVEGIYNYFDPDYTFFYCSLGLGYIIDDVFLNKLIYGYFVYLSYFAVVDDYYAVGFLNSEAAAAPNKNSGF